MAESFKMTMTPEEKARWSAKAEEDGISLAKWLRNAANAYGPPSDDLGGSVLIEVPDDWRWCAEYDKMELIPWIKQCCDDDVQATKEYEQDQAKIASGEVKSKPKPITPVVEKKPLLPNQKRFEPPPQSATKAFKHLMPPDEA